MKTAENLCFGFGCWGKDFFAKVSYGVFGNIESYYIHCIFLMIQPVCTAMMVFNL